MSDFSQSPKGRTRSVRSNSVTSRAEYFLPVRDYSLPAAHMVDILGVFFSTICKLAARRSVGHHH